MTVTTVDWSEDQERAVDAAWSWRESAKLGGAQTFTLAGLAGTGKTTISSHLADSWPGTATCALAGKAAHVLRCKGVAATTIHGLIYEPYEGPGGRIAFRLRDCLPGVSQVLCDEASMVNCDLHDHLLSFGLPVLFVGDHGQLEPIGKNPHLMKSPDVRLERIHRQAADNPILRAAMAVREGRPLPCWSDPKDRLHVMPIGQFWRNVCPTRQVVCGFNKTRHAVNRKCREQLAVTQHLVAEGDRLICLKNNYNFNVFNGQMATVLDVLRQHNGTIDLLLKTDDGREAVIPTSRFQYGENLIEDWRNPDVCLFDYGFATTTHKSQGSEWPEVLVRDEVCDLWDPRRWRYTAVTRAKDRLIYCR